MSAHTPMISGTTRLGGLIGSPVAHSLSPLMHNYSFARLGIDRIYLCFEAAPDELSGCVRGLKALGAYGFNLTMPHKQAVLEYLDEVTEAARLTGAVNTVAIEDGRLIGYNTDGIGYMQCAKDAGFEAGGQVMTLLGAGGAAHAIAIQAALDGLSVLHVCARRSASWAKAAALVDTINRETSCRADLTDLQDQESLRRHLQESRLLTNATSAGMKPHEDELPLPDPDLMHPGLIVSDVIYEPQETRLLSEAKARGCTTFNGLYMLLYQGAEAFRIWCGRDMPVEEVRALLAQG